MKISGFLSFSKKILHYYNKLSKPVIKKYDIPQVSFDILMFLAVNPEYHTAQDISELRRIKKNLVSVHVEKLVNAGYLERTVVAGDRRKIGLVCTPKADPIIQDGLDMHKVFINDITKGISEKDWNICKEILVTMEKNADNMI
ncbi:MAG: winged helix-turn-helix transcriptional regulator [Ruminococcus sp.]|nr:winged helix-turn-helix transcriptional regulator [Ruminococcus sp.]MBQ9956073.1 winged helix-turn-helix transcriptional regulator [Ruminococcus sp.]